MHGEGSPEPQQKVIFGNITVRDLKCNGRLYYAAIPNSLLEFKNGEHRSFEFGKICNVGGVYISMPAPGVAAVLTGVKYVTDWGQLRPLLAVEVNKKNIYD